MNGLIGRQIDHYRIEALLGEGGMGAVYRAHDLNLARPVALKVMHAQLASQPEFKARFMQEAQSAAGLSHPSVVTVHYFGASHNLLYMVMAYIAGGSLSAHLRQVLQKGEAVQLREILIFLSQVADALGYAHRQGVVHRDIKPSNVLVQRLPTPDRDTGMPLRAVVTDFGLAKLMTGGFETKSDVLIGTYPYMSPEQCLHLTVDGRSDIYSLGVMLYQLTTGKLPLDIKSATDAVLKHHSGAMPLPPREAWPGLPVVIEEIINKAIAKKPEERFQTGEEIASALREAGKTLVEEEVTQYVGQRNVKSLSTVAEPEVSRAEPSRMGFDLQPGPGGDRLIIAQKEHTPRSIPLDRPSLTIGRTADNDIVLDHRDISRRHARLDQTATGWRVTDLGSTNGTHLGGNKLLKDSPEDLPPGETMRLGPYFIHWQRVEARSAVGSLMGSGVRLPSGATHFQSKSGQVGVIVKPAKAEIMPGTRAAIQVELFNEATLVDHLKLSISGLPPNWVTLRDPVTELMPGGTATMTFEVHPPQDASARAGTHPYNLMVTSEAKPGESMTVPGEIVVQPFERFTVEFHPSQLPDGGKTQVTIRNQGNAEGTYSLTGRDPAGAVQFAGEHGRIRAASGQAAVQEVTVKAKSRPLFGTPQSLPFELMVKSTSNAQQALPGQLKVNPWLPRWVPMLFGLFLLLCVFGGRYAYVAGIVQPSQTASAGTATSNALIALAQESGTQAAQQNAATGTAAAQTAIALGDDDTDGLSNQKEAQLETDPNKADTDSDGLRDGDEVNVYSTEPKNIDTDNDGLSDGDEVNLHHTLPKNPDSDGDSVNDGAEVRNGTDPLATPMPTSSATTTPLPPVPPTATPTPTPTEPVTGFPGTWINVRENPVAFAVSEPLTRLVIAKVDRDTATFSSCKCLTDACQSQVELDPPKVVANLAGDELRADTNFNVAENHTWSIKAIKAGSNLLVTVQERRPDGATPSETFEMKPKPVNPVANPLFDSCEPPVFILPIFPVFILPSPTP